MNDLDEFLNNLHPELRRAMEESGFDPTRGGHQLEEAVAKFKAMAESMDDATRERLASHAADAIGLDNKAKGDLAFMFKCHDSVSFETFTPKGSLGVEDGALRLFVERCWQEAVETSGGHVDENSFKMGLIGGMLYGQEMTERRHA